MLFRSNTEKDELYGKLQVHFIENVEAEESSEEKESDSGNLSDETARKSVSAEKENRAKKPVQKDIEEASAKSKGKKSEPQSDSSKTDSEDDVKERWEYLRRATTVLPLRRRLCRIPL